MFSEFREINIQCNFYTHILQGTIYLLQKLGLVSCLSQYLLPGSDVPTVAQVRDMVALGWGN